ncbi:uncharacterized protein MONOS_18065 [Monocercomonoides exilis]|uniref:uncharacterized protein n=1 Tax=Monocercomonoides exilis TaxID=2049356 RepID=UPI00355A578D|nr:hypothetical protein MONOS_18065 [Monocercomonoides exilis]
MTAQQQQRRRRQIVHGAAVERFPQERLAKHLRHDVRLLRRVISCQDGLAQLVIALDLVGRWNIGLCVGSTATLFGVS